jgi:hypothetical protein
MNHAPAKHESFKTVRGDGFDLGDGPGRIERHRQAA